MHGNVWEWCQDWYGSDYDRQPPVEDPQGPTSGTSRVYRGGSFISFAMSCRSADRNSMAAVAPDLQRRLPCCPSSVRQVASSRKSGQRSLERRLMRRGRLPRRSKPERRAVGVAGAGLMKSSNALRFVSVIVCHWLCLRRRTSHGTMQRPCESPPILAVPVAQRASQSGEYTSRQYSEIGAGFPQPQPSTTETVSTNHETSLRTPDRTCESKRVTCYGKGKGIGGQGNGGGEECRRRRIR